MLKTQEDPKVFSGKRGESENKVAALEDLNLDTIFKPFAQIPLQNGDKTRGWRKNHGKGYCPKLLKAQESPSTHELHLWKTWAD